MICGAADEGSAALFVCGGGTDLPGGQIGVGLLCGRGECVGGREKGAGFARRANRREVVVGKMGVLNFK